MSDLTQSKEAMVSAYAGLAKALKATHKSVVEFQKALEGADPARAADLLRDMPQMPSFGGDDSGKAGKKGKKEKKEKDPNAPKRPPSAYLEYQNSVRDDIRAANKEMPYAEVLRKIAAAWGSMPDKEKQTWTDLTAKRTEEYEKVKAAYAETLAAAEGDSSAKPAKGVEVEASGKKRGRKSEADKKKEQEDTLAKIAAAVDTPSAPKEKKRKAVAAVQAATPAKAAPPPAPESSSSEESSEDDSSDDSSDESSSEDEPAPPPVKKSKKDKKADDSTKKKAKH